MTDEPVFRFGPFTLDRRGRRLLGPAEEPVKLKPKEWELLCCLIDHRGRALSKSELLDDLWPRQSVTDANLSQAIYAVRKALGESAREPYWIETVPRLGYRFAVRDEADSTKSSSRDARSGEVIDGVPAAARAAYKRGRYCWRRFTEKSLYQAMAYFDEALEAAPRFAKAHAWRSATWSALGNIGALTPRNSAEHARRAADRAVAIDESLATGYEMRGVVELYFDWNFEAALRSFKQAIQRDARSANAHHLLANAQAFAGDFASAHDNVERALLLDPASMITRTDAALFHYLAGDYEMAQKGLLSVLDQEPGFPHARIKLAFVHGALGDAESAIGECEAVATSLGSRHFGAYAYAMGRAKRTREAKEMLKHLKYAAERRDADPYGVALGYAGVGERKEALAWLERAVDYRSRELVLLTQDPVWEPIRQHPKFSETVDKVGYR